MLRFLPFLAFTQSELLDPTDWKYHSYTDVTRLFESLQAQYPNLVLKYSLGTSQENRELWAIQVTNLITLENDVLRTKVKLVGNMHGDESIGHELPIQTAVSLLKSYEAGDARAQGILNSLNLHFIPSVNPDGFEHSHPDCRISTQHRNTMSNKDMNRDFPDPFRNRDWQPEYDANGKITNWSEHSLETRLVMEYLLSNHFTLSLNFHAGAVVASYPLDGRDIGQRGYSAAPDDKLFKHLAHIYADNHGTMAKDSRQCGDSFHGGVTNGADWYALSGGMEDFNYFWTDCFEITIELTCCKYPPAEELEIEWHRNKESILSYIEQAYLSVRGFVKNQFGPHKGKVIIETVSSDENYIPKNVTAFQQGDSMIYRRLLPQGSYKIRAVQGSRVTNWQEIAKVEMNMKIDLDFENGDDLAPESPPEETIFQQHNHEKMVEFLEKMQKTCPDIMRVYSIGKSVNGVDILVTEFGQPDSIGKHKLAVPDVKLIAGQHGNEANGRELLIHLIKNICEHEINQLDLLSAMKIHIMPEYNPDGYKKSRVGDNFGVIGRENEDRIDMNRDWPVIWNDNKRLGSKPMALENKLVKEWCESLPFVLSADLHGGDLVANYPWDDYRSGKGNRGGESPTPDDEYFK